MASVIQKGTAHIYITAWSEIGVVKADNYTKLGNFYVVTLPGQRNKRVSNSNVHQTLDEAERIMTKRLDEDTKDLYEKKKKMIIDSVKILRENE